MTIPTYKAVLNYEEDGITTISWVSDPATMVDMICFSEEDRDKYRFADDEKHMVTSVVMLADTKIYRRNGDFEYYITYEKDTLLQMCEKMLKDNTYKNISFEHDGKNIDPDIIRLVELYTVDENKKSPFNVPNGSIIATYKVNDSDMWELFKSGEIGGISLEGYFSTEEVQKNSNIKMSLKDKLKELFMNFSKVETDKAVLVWEGEGELEVGVEVTDENGEVIADGEYMTEDKVIVIADGKVAEIKEKETVEGEDPTEPQMNEETTETTPATTDNSAEIAGMKETIMNLEATVETLKADVEALKAKLAEPAAPSPEDEFKKQRDAIAEKYARLGAALKL